MGESADASGWRVEPRLRKPEPWRMYARVPVEAAAQAIQQRPTPFEFTGPGWRITGVVTEMSWSGGPNATVTLEADSATSDIGTEAPFWLPADLSSRDA